MEITANLQIFPVSETEIDAKLQIFPVSETEIVIQTPGHAGLCGTILTPDTWLLELDVYLGSYQVRQHENMKLLIIKSKLSKVNNFDY